MNSKFYAAMAVLLLSVVALADPFQSQSQQQQPTQPSSQTQGQGKKGDTGAQTNADRQQSQQSGQSANQSSARLSNSDRRFVNEAAQAGMAEVAHGQLAVERASSDEVKRFAQQMIDDHTKSNQELMQLATTKGISLPNGMMEHQAGNQSGQQSDQRTSANQSRQPSSQTGSQSTTGARTQTDSQTTTDTQTSGQAATKPSPQSGAQTGQQSGRMSGQQTNLQGKHRDMMNRLAKLSGAEFDREYMRSQLKDHENAVALFERQANSGSDAELKAFASSTLPTLREHLQLARDTAAKVGASDSKSGRNSGNTSRPKQ